MERHSTTGLWAMISMVAAASAGLSGVAHAGAEPHLKSGAVGIARLQTARLTAVNYEPTAVESTGPGGESCAAILSFQDVDNRPSPERFARTLEVTLAPGDTGVLDVRASEFLGSSARTRGALSASVRLRSGDACRNVVVTLEIFDSVTGRTGVLLGHSSFVDDAAPAVAGQ